MKFATKKTLADVAYLFGITMAAFGLGWMWGHDDTIKGLKELASSDEEPEEKPAIEWAEGGEEAFYEALEEADKEANDESEN